MKFHEALRAFDGFLFRFEVENGEAADDFLRLSERAISGLQLSASDANVRARLGWRETASGDHCAGFVRLLGKLVDGVHQSLRGRSRKFFSVFDQHHKSHVRSPFDFSVEAEFRSLRPLKTAAVETSNENCRNRPLAELLFSFEFLAEFAVPIDSFAGSEIVQLEELAEFDFTFAILAFVGSGSPLGPLERLFAGLDLDDPLTGDEFLCFGESAVNNGAFSARKFDARAFRAWLEAGEIEQYTGFHQLLVVLGHPGK